MFVTINQINRIAGIVPAAFFVTVWDRLATTAIFGTPLARRTMQVAVTLTYKLGAARVTYAG